MSIAISRLAAFLLGMGAFAASAFPINPRQVEYEYVNERTGHFVLLDFTEGQMVESGAAGPGWQKTGYLFMVARPGAVPGAMPVCRFYSAANNSHFFTANAAECDSLRNVHGDWSFEEIPFDAEAAGPACAAPLRPVYRLYNNRHAMHDANHRFTPDPAVREEMIQAGWIDEGVAFCTSSWSLIPQKSFEVSSSVIADVATCESHTGGCIALHQLPAMPTLIYSWLPPGFVNRNPSYPADAPGVTNAGFVDLWTFLTADDPSIARHSFVQAFDKVGLPYGIHLNGVDRKAGAAASISPLYHLGATERVFPWRGPRDHTLVATIDVDVHTVRAANADSRASGTLILEFADTVSGRSFLAAAQVYGTMVAHDSSGIDAQSGKPFVATSFRADPAFGTALKGSYLQCFPQSSAMCGASEFQLRITRADFAAAVARARDVDAALSQDPADYTVAEVAFRNEVLGTGESGLTLGRMALDVWY
jgi:hypothetical protein